MKTIIAVPDFTREAHLKNILPVTINKLNRLGIEDKDIEILIATGLHRSPTKKEIMHHLGHIAERINVSAHDYRNSYYIGRSKNHIPIYIDTKLKYVDSIITIGVVEPHLYAGYSGGIKTVAIGLAGEKTINATHHPRFLDHPGTKICSILNNPFQDFIQDIGSRLPIKYSINIVNDGSEKILRVFEGRPLRCFKNAATFAQKIFQKRINKYFDAVICGIPFSKSVNIYQASRAFNYLINVGHPVIRQNAFVLVKAGLKEGFGKGLGEKRFIKKIMAMKSPEKLIDEIKKGGCLAGEHRAYMVAKALTKARLGFISERAQLYKNMGLPFLFFKDIKESEEYIKVDPLRKNFSNRVKPDICRLKNAFTTILTKI